MSNESKVRRHVEVWFHLKPGRPLSECLHDLDANNYRIQTTDMPVDSVGHSLVELARLVLLLAPPEGGAGKPKEDDLIVVPGTPHVLLLFKYAVYPPFAERHLMAFGGHRYALDLGAFLTHGSYHPCYCSLPVGSGVAVEMREPG